MNLCREKEAHGKTQTKFEDTLEELKKSKQANDNLSETNARLRGEVRELPSHPVRDDPMQKQLDEANEHLDQTRRFLIRLVNKKVMEIHRLKKELKETNMQLEKAKEPAPQTVTSWIHENVPADVTEEPPALYPDDWQPLDSESDTVTPVQLFGAAYLSNAHEAL
ncbi:hypothetical protein Q5P01_009594 [Channa striata]|uniref:Uncharacterized protein n=1 Tax=Channa striata TaxID=64152 RepID=A0AA88SSE5_CHASR|nr:hypothetical protein Q5P01_009594 [Channa striata]